MIAMPSRPVSFSRPRSILLKHLGPRGGIASTSDFLVLNVYKALLFQRIARLSTSFWRDEVVCITCQRAHLLQKGVLQTSLLFSIGMLSLSTSFGANLGLFGRHTVSGITTYDHVKCSDDKTRITNDSTCNVVVNLYIANKYALLRVTSCPLIELHPIVKKNSATFPWLHYKVG